MPSSSSSSRPAMLFPSILAISMCLAGVGNARNPLQTQQQQPQQTSIDLVQRKIVFADPNSDAHHLLRLPTEEDNSISVSEIENPQERPHQAYPQLEPRFPIHGRPSHTEFGRYRFQNEREMSFRRSRLGRPGGRYHTRPRADFARRYFSGIKGPDSISLRLDSDGELGTFGGFPAQRESAEFRPGHRFGPADMDMGDSTPYDSHVVPRKHLRWAFPRDEVARPHETQQDGGWMGWFNNLSHRP